jgi:hypothetical protein
MLAHGPLRVQPTHGWRNEPPFAMVRMRFGFPSLDHQRKCIPKESRLQGVAPVDFFLEGDGSGFAQINLRGRSAFQGISLFYTPCQLECQECARSNLSGMCPVCTPVGAPAFMRGEATWGCTCGCHLDRIDSFSLRAVSPARAVRFVASTADNGRTQDNLSVTATAQDRPVPHTPVLRVALCGL